METLIIFCVKSLKRGENIQMCNHFPKIIPIQMVKIINKKVLELKGIQLFETLHFTVMLKK